MPITFFKIKALLESRHPVSYDLIQYLLKKDLLLNSKHTLVPGYEEAPIFFEPTYKRHSNTGRFKLEKIRMGFPAKGRLPGYTDRIFIKTKIPIHKFLYDSIPMKGNDHYPVFYACELSSLKIGVITWNIGHGKPEHLSPDNLRIHFGRFGTDVDVLIIGFQEASIHTEPNVEIWDGIYDSYLKMHGFNMKALLGHIAGFGIETCILWNKNVLDVN